MFTGMDVRHGCRRSAPRRAARRSRQDARRISAGRYDHLRGVPAIRRHADSRTTLTSADGRLRIGSQPEGENLNAVTIPELKRLAGKGAVLPVPAAHGPHSPIFRRVPSSESSMIGTSSTRKTRLGAGHGVQAVLRLLRTGSRQCGKTISSRSATERWPMDACIQNIFTTVRNWASRTNARRD